MKPQGVDLFAIDYALARMYYLLKVVSNILTPLNYSVNLVLNQFVMQIDAING